MANTALLADKLTITAALENDTLRRFEEGSWAQYAGQRAPDLVAAVGRPEMIRGDWVKPGACVIDVGINRVVDPGTGKGRIVGDVDFASAVAVAGSVTPVPGGVGPMTIALLMANTITAAARAAGRPELAGSISA